MTSERRSGEATNREDRNERQSPRSRARAKSLRNRANRRHQEQALASLGTSVDAERAEEIESNVFHRRPVDAGVRAPSDLGRETIARRRRRERLKSLTSRRDGGRRATHEDESGS